MIEIVCRGERGDAASDAFRAVLDRLHLKFTRRGAEFSFAMNVAPIIRRMIDIWGVLPVAVDESGADFRIGGEFALRELTGAADPPRPALLEGE